MKIVLSYRRADAPAMTGWIFEHLVRHYGQENVFRDIDSIPFGVDFREHIQEQLNGCDALIAIVGPRWLGGRGKGLRIKDETDWVRIEVEIALRRNIPVVPVLVEGATMPRPDQLPETLRNLAFYNAASVDSGRDFGVHVERLIRSLDRLLGQSANSRQPEATTSANVSDTPAITPEQMIDLGHNYRDGRGVPQDDTEAVRWYRKAADLGHALAMTNLGIMYENGRGVPQDDAETVRWFRKAADLGHALAMTNLGFMYENGRGVPQDDTEAVRWYRKAVDLGYAGAMTNLGISYRDGRGVPQDDAEAVRWFRKAADLGDTDAMANLGFMYEKGRSVPQDDAEAMRCFRKADNLGYERAKTAVHQLGG